MDAESQVKEQQSLNATTQQLEVRLDKLAAATKDQGRSPNDEELVESGLITAETLAVAIKQIGLILRSGALDAFHQKAVRVVVVEALRVVANVAQETVGYAEHSKTCDCEGGREARGPLN